MKHVTVFGQRGVYAGWPANHGAWQWGDEFLVGFMTGPHTIGAMHNIREPYAKVLARSLDGGDSWTGENPTMDFSASETSPAPLVTLDADAIIRVCGRYDHGGYDAARHGGFYLSMNKGRSWQGAYAFDGLEHHFTGKNQNTSRTCVLDDMIFLSAAQRNCWGTDYVFVAKHDGRFFHEHGIVYKGLGRAVMPRAARVGDRLVVVMRRLGAQYDGGWIDAVFSDDDGKTWSAPQLVGMTGAHNGNPPALIELNGSLYCAYANRSDCEMRLSRSEDGGETWKLVALLREHGDSDIGYPQLFKRSDGQLVCVYYWADTYEDCQRIEATIFRP
ncbi:hypothetical protein MesoLjLc_50880 [Mesorhizobium sp. L-8-10]|uniref:sialidase family protein n=1 Tax=Mesorhizobium sp. L-8-10 TaxID=2744523 RepID=UPI001928079F|nr:sialidase family protein [Mesorhizobium sp. L-8-10]BCH33158.1 hypothetical protein MesoLjLc_50880 [Mesorhizobium sp. L-8-10]